MANYALQIVSESRTEQMWFPHWCYIFCLFLKQSTVWLTDLTLIWLFFWRPGSKQLSSSLLTCFYSKRLEKWRERLFHLCVTHFFSRSRCRDEKNVVNYLFTFLFLFEVDEVAGWILMGPSVLYCINLTHKQVQAYSNMWATSIPFVFRVILFKIWNLPLI